MMPGNQFLTLSTKAGYCDQAGILSTRGKPLQQGRRGVLPVRAAGAVPLLWATAAAVLYLSPPGSAFGFLAALGTTIALALLIGVPPTLGGHRAARPRARDLRRKLADPRLSSADGAAGSAG